MKTNFTSFSNKQRLSSIIILAGLLTGVCRFTQAAETPLPEPTVDQSADFRVPHFGSDRTVELLGNMLLKSDDINERTQAAANLGQTNNMNAVKFLAKGFADKNQQVREAVVTASAVLAKQTPEYMHATSAEYKQAVDIIKKAFGDSSQNVKLAAISAAGSANILTDEIVKTAEGDDAVLATQALNICNNINGRLPIKTDSLVKHLNSGNLQLQLAAIENFVTDGVPVLKKVPVVNKETLVAAKKIRQADSSLVVSLKKLAASQNDAMAAAAIRAMATLNPTIAKLFIEKAAKSSSPLLRRAAVKSFAVYEEVVTKPQPTTGPAAETADTTEIIQMYDRIPAFLDDPSPLVKLAAVQAVVTAHMYELRLQQTQKLIDIAFAAPDTQLHKAAIYAAIATDDGSLIKIAADAYKKMMPEYLTIKNPAGSILERNLSSVCKILCEKKSGAVFDEMLADIEKLQLDSIIIGDIADALGNIGNKSASDVLEKMLKKCQATGAKYLIAMASMSTPPAFSEPVTVKIINALATLDAKKSAKGIVNIALLNVMNMRLTTVAAAVPPALVKLRDGSNESAADKLLVDMIADDSYGNLAIFNAVIATGKLRINAALPGLEKIINEERPSKITIWAAAWAVGQISGGKYPAQPQPVANQGNWIIKSMESTK